MDYKKGEYLAKAPKGDVYDPGVQVKKAVGKTYADTPKKIVENIVE